MSPEKTQALVDAVKSLEAAKLAEKSAQTAYYAAMNVTEKAQGVLAVAQSKMYFSGGLQSCLPAGLNPITKGSIQIHRIANSLAFSGSYKFPGWMDVEVGLTTYHLPIPEWHEWNREEDARREARKSRVA